MYSRTKSKMSTPKKDFTNLMEKIKQMPTKVKEAPPQKFGKWGVGLVLGGIGFGWVAFPYILSFAMSKMVNLQEGNPVRNVWKAIPYLFDFNIYIFNVTNPMEVQKGAIPIVQEVGPYRYKEFKEKVDLVDDVDQETITYSNMNTWYFQKERTLPLTGEEVVTVPHLPLWSMLLVAEGGFPPPFLSFISAAVPKIYGKLKTVFMTVKVNDLLFKGVLIDCSAKEFLPKIICAGLKQNSQDLVKLGNNRYLFSFFGTRNATPENNRITVKNGVGDASTIGQVVRINGKTENTMWLDGECNRFAGTDASIFPPYRTPDNNSIVAYSTEICRSIYGTYEGDGEYRGIKGYRYSISFGDTRNNPRDSCYCLKGSVCPKKGALDLTKCQGAPLFGTMPHFYASDESFLKGVIGLRPEKEKHEVFFLMEPISAAPLIARKRFQFNIPIHPVQYVGVTKKLKSTMMPIAWVEESLDLDGELMDHLEANLLSNLRMVNIIKWTLILLGVGLCSVGIFMHKKKKQREPSVIRVTPMPSGSFESNLSRSTISSKEQLISPLSKRGKPLRAGVILEPSVLKEISGGYAIKKSHASNDPEYVSTFAGKLQERLNYPASSAPLESISHRLQQQPQIVMTSVPPIQTSELREAPPVGKREVLPIHSTKALSMRSMRNYRKSELRSST